MPREILVANDGLISNKKLTNTYKADGEKIRKNVDYFDATYAGWDETTVGYQVNASTDYLGGFIYENNNLQMIPTAEGYVKMNYFVNPPRFEYVYQHKDHVENTRLVYSDSNKNGIVEQSEIMEETNYYPFGLAHKGYGKTIPYFSYSVGTGKPVTETYKTFQGQQFTDDFSLNVHSWKYRTSDPTTGRFWQIDPLSEKYVYNSTYAFQENKMGLGRELEGLELWVQTNGSQSTPMYFANKDIGLKNNPNAVPMTADPLRGISQDSAGNISYRAGDTSVVLHADGRQTQNKITYEMQDKTPYTDVRDQSMTMAFMSPLALPLALETGVVSAIVRTGQFIGYSGAVSGGSDALLQRAFKGSWSEVDVKQSSIAAVVKNPVAQLGLGSANNFLNSEIDDSRNDDLGRNTLKIATGGMGTLFSELGSATRPGLQGQILGSIMGNTFSNTTDAVIDIEKQNKKK